MIGKVAFASVIACVGGTLFADASMVLDLTADRTLDVPAGEVTTVTRLTGGPYTLTKTVAGTVEGWTVTGVEKGAVRLALKADGLYAEFLPSGLLVIAR